MELLYIPPDLQITLIGVGIAVLAVIIVLFLIKWESKRATSYWEKRNKKE